MASWEPDLERDVGHTDAQAMAAEAPASNRPATPTGDGAALSRGSLDVSRFEISPREREDNLERDRRDFDPEPEEPVWYEVRIVDDED